MAILIPVLSKVRRQAKAVVCQVNLKQWGLIWSMYCDDNNGYFSTGIDVGWKRGQWITVLRPQYETKSDILRCPMAMKRLEGKSHGGPFNTYVMGEGGTGGDIREEASYGQNNWLYHSPSDVDEIQGRPTKWNWRTVYVKGGDKIPVFTDTMWRGGGPFYKDNNKSSIRIVPPESNGKWNDYDAEMHHFCIDRHGTGTVNYVFLDWSVRKVELKELWKLKWHRQFDTNGAWTIAGGVKPNDWPQWMRKFKDY